MIPAEIGKTRLNLHPAPLWKTGSGSSLPKFILNWQVSITAVWPVTPVLVSMTELDFADATHLMHKTFLVTCSRGAGHYPLMQRCWSRFRTESCTRLGRWTMALGQLLKTSPATPPSEGRRQRRSTTPDLPAGCGLPRAPATAPPPPTLTPCSQTPAR